MSQRTRIEGSSKNWTYGENLFLFLFVSKQKMLRWPSTDCSSLTSDSITRKRSCAVAFLEHNEPSRFDSPLGTRQFRTSVHAVLIGGTEPNRRKIEPVTDLYIPPWFKIFFFEFHPTPSPPLFIIDTHYKSILGQASGDHILWSKLTCRYRNSSLEALTRTLLASSSPPKKGISLLRWVFP